MHIIKRFRIETFSQTRKAAVSIFISRTYQPQRLSRLTNNSVFSVYMDYLFRVVVPKKMDGE